MRYKPHEFLKASIKLNVSSGVCNTTKNKRVKNPNMCLRAIISVKSFWNLQGNNSAKKLPDMMSRNMNRLSTGI